MNTHDESRAGAATPCSGEEMLAKETFKAIGRDDDPPYVSFTFQVRFLILCDAR